MSNESLEPERFLLTIRKRPNINFINLESKETMKIEVSKEELQAIRDILWEGRAHYSRAHERTGMVKIGDKLIRKVNAALKKVHGHDCCGDRYL